MKVIQLGKLKIEAPLSSDTVAVLRGNQVVRVSLESLIGGGGEIPNLATVATTGKYSDLLERPTVGNGLSESNFTLEEKQKLEGIAEGANNFSLPNASSGQVLMYGAQGWEAGTVENTTYTATNGIKLVGTSIEAVFGSTANTITQGNDPRLTNSREWTASVVPQAEAETGTATTARKWTAQRVRQAILGWWASSSEKTKLDGIATGATKNATDAQLRDRTTHTGEQPISTVTGLQSALDIKVNNDDARLTNSREWTASVVSQAEAEAGTSSTARKWTAQRVRQNVTAHWNGVTSTWGRGLVNSANAAAGRSALGLENVDNTSDINKPISSATQSALASKVNKETGKTLISTADLQKLSGIEAGAQVNLVSVDNLTSDSTTRPLSANQGRILKNLIDSINTLLQSDDSSLDELQEIVDFIKLNREDLDSLGISSIAGLEDALAGKQPLNSILTGTTASFTTALKTKLDAIAAQATKNSTDAQLRDRSTHTGTQAISTVSGLQISLDSKVDKVTGKGLSTEDFTTTEKSKLAGVATGATKNATDAHLLSRTNHTGTQAISTVSGLQTALDGKVDNTDSRLTNSREWTGATVSQAEAEAGTATTRRAWTAQRVRQSIQAWFLTVSGTFGRTILGRSTAAEVRSDLGLGTAATRNVGTGSGNLMEVGAFGLGGNTATPTSNSGYGNPTGFYYISGEPGGAFFLDVQYTSTIPAFRISNTPYTNTFFLHGSINNTTKELRPPVEISHSGNIQTTTGSSTTNPMTQKAVTDALATKANTTTQVIAGNGLSGGGTLAANRTITLGTPSTLTSSTTNAVTATSHTHEIVVTKADVGLSNVLNVASYSKTESDARYYTQTTADSRYAYKAGSSSQDFSAKDATVTKLKFGSSAEMVYNASSKTIDFIFS